MFVVRWFVLCVGLFLAASARDAAPPHLEVGERRTATRLLTRSITFILGTPDPRGLRRPDGCSFREAETCPSPPGKERGMTSAS
jgi:hypothetical protein